MSDETLDLDALLGEAKRLKVRVDGAEYELRHADALTPPEFARLARLGRELQGAEQDEAALERSLGAIDEFLRIVGGEWALGLPMRAKMAILQFWGRETGAGNAEKN